MDNNRESEVKKAPEPLPVDPEEILDWDAYSPPPPPKNRRTIRVQLRHKEHAIQPSPVTEEDIEKDDVFVPTPPPRRSGTILVQLKYRGRSKPIPVDFTEDYEESNK